MSAIPGHILSTGLKKRASGSARRTIVVIDYKDHARGGHFGPWLKWFVTEFARRFDSVLVFTPLPAHTEQLLELSPSERKKISCHALPPGPRKAFYRLKRKWCPLAKIVERAQRLAPAHELHAFVMWGDDLLIQDVAKDRCGVPFGTLGGNSFWRRGFPGRSARREEELAQLCSTHPDCAALLVPDNFMISPEDPKTIWIPGYENVELLPEGEAAQAAGVRAIRSHAAGHFCVGSFGMLGGGRAVDEILRLTRIHPAVRFVLAGKIAVESVQEDLRPRLDADRPPNLLVIPSFFATDGEMNAAMNSVDAVLLDGSHYPVHSGIVSRGLAFGKCILTPESNSWTADVIRAYGAGLAYADRESDLAAAWRAWRESGGEQRSRAAAAALMGEDAIAASFDRLAAQLAAPAR
jgi:hypothetical protein